MNSILFDMTDVTPLNLKSSIPLYKFRFLNSLTKREAANIKLLIKKELEEFIKSEYPDFTYDVLDEKHSLLEKIPVLRQIYHNLQYRRKVNQSGCQTLLVANDMNFRALSRNDLKLILIIHDLKALKDNKGFKYYKYFFLYKRLCKLSSRIIAISKYTKEDIIKLLSIDDDKIKVVYNSISLPCHSMPLESSLPKHYILYINTLQKYKNVLTLIKAFNQIKNNTEFNLVIVGKETSYWKEEVVPYINDNKLNKRIIRFQNLTDEQIKYLYEHASLFVTTSTREGFGYTPIEAAICGCPVISTKCEALADTTQGILNYYEPAHNYKGLANKIINIINDYPDKKTLDEISNKFKRLYNPITQKEKILSEC